MDWSERTQLLPKSGIGVLAPWLVIAPPGNPAIRLDVRALDHVKLLTDDADDIEDPRCQILLVCGELEIAMHVADGREAAERIVQEAAALTREATGVRSAVELSQVLIIGDDAVLQRGDYIEIGKVAFYIGEVLEYARHGENIPLPDGSLIQAAITTLVIAVGERDAASE